MDGTGKVKGAALGAGGDLTVERTLSSKGRCNCSEEPADRRGGFCAESSGVAIEAVVRGVAAGFGGGFVVGASKVNAWGLGGARCRVGCRSAKTIGSWMARECSSIGGK